MIVYPPSGRSIVGCRGLHAADAIARPGDPVAAAIVAALAAAGATVSGAQAAAIRAYRANGVANGWWARAHRLYFPTWAAAAPNAVDWVALGSGTWNGGWTHNAGHALPDGTTGWFNTGSMPATNGMTKASGALAFYTSNNASLASAPADIGSDGAVLYSARVCVVNYLRDHYFGLAYDAGWSTSTAAFGAGPVGLMVANRAGGAFTLHHRHAGGITQKASTVKGDSATPLGSNPLAGAAMNRGATRTEFSPKPYAHWAVFHSGFDTVARREAYMNATYTLLAALGATMV